MITPVMAGFLIGSLLILVSAILKDEKWKIAYGTIGIIFILWGFGLFSLSGPGDALIAPMTLLFGSIAIYTSGNTQLLSILITVILASHIV